MVLKGLEQSGHPLHPANPEEIEALKRVSRIKRYADEHPEAPPFQILRNELRDIAPGNNIIVVLKISHLFLTSKFL